MVLLAQLKASFGLTVDKSLHNDNLVWRSFSPLDLIPRITWTFFRIIVNFSDSSERGHWSQQSITKKLYSRSRSDSIWNSSQWKMEMVKFQSSLLWSHFQGAAPTIDPFKGIRKRDDDGWDLKRWQLDRLRSLSRPHWHWQLVTGRGLTVACNVVKRSMATSPANSSITIRPGLYISLRTSPVFPLRYSYNLFLEGVSPIPIYGRVDITYSVFTSLFSELGETDYSTLRICLCTMAVPSQY